MNLVAPNSKSKHYYSIFKVTLLLATYLFTFPSYAANGPSVNQLSISHDATWGTLLKVTNCNQKPPQDSQCLRKQHGKTIIVKYFGKQVNALILFETATTEDLSGSIFIQQSGFLIGPIHGFGYKVINEKQAHGLHHKRHITDNGLKVFAHPFNGKTINPQGIELNNGQHWLDGKNEPWIYHWSALSKVNEVLKEIKVHLNKKYK